MSGIITRGRSVTPKVDLNNPVKPDVLEALYKIPTEPNPDLRRARKLEADVQLLQRRKITENINIALPTISSFVQLRHIAEQANVELSLLGTLSIRVKGYEDSLPIDALPARILGLFKRHNICKGVGSNPKKLEKRVARLYARGDDLVKQSNCFTKGIFYLREFFSACYALFYMRSQTTRSQWNGEIGVDLLTRKVARI